MRGFKCSGSSPCHFASDELESKPSGNIGFGICCRRNFALKAEVRKRVVQNFGTPAYKLYYPAATAEVAEAKGLENRFFFSPARANRGVALVVLCLCLLSCVSLLILVEAALPKAKVIFRSCANEFACGDFCLKIMCVDSFSHFWAPSRPQDAFQPPRQKLHGGEPPP